MPPMRRLALLAVLSLAACKKDEPPPPPAPKPAEAKPTPKPAEAPVPKAEVEVRGKIAGALPGGAVKFFLAEKPCAEAQDKVIGGANVGPAGTFFVEVFVPQGTQAYLCAVEFDPAGKQLAMAQDARGAVKLEGQGEVELSVNLALAATPNAGAVSPAVRGAHE